MVAFLEIIRCVHFNNKVAQIVVIKKQPDAISGYFFGYGSIVPSQLAMRALHSYLFVRRVCDFIRDLIRNYRKDLGVVFCKLSKNLAVKLNVVLFESVNEF